jgi:hypothetical protein
VSPPLSLPRRGRGRPSAAGKVAWDKKLKEFCDFMRSVHSDLGIAVSSRGWCYIFEDRLGVKKGDFGYAEGLINDCRKAGLIPIDICAEDAARQFACVEQIDEDDPADFAADIAQRVDYAHLTYDPVSFWEYQEYYLEVLVEKIDLKSLWEPTCKKYRIPIANAKGWPDINTRANMMRRFHYWESKGKRVVLLYAGDFDPAGLNISSSYKDMFEELKGAVGWDPAGLEIDRFGLNEAFIHKHKLTWIDNLITSSGEDLADPKHPQHNYPYVQSYIAAYGVRKCEANALVTAPEPGRKLFRDTIWTYLSEEGIAEWEAKRDRLQQEAKSHLDRLLGRDQAEQAPATSTRRRRRAGDPPTAGQMALLPEEDEE